MIPQIVKFTPHWNKGIQTLFLLSFISIYEEFLNKNEHIITIRKWVNRNGNLHEKKWIPIPIQTCPEVRTIYLLTDQIWMMTWSLKTLRKSKDQPLIVIHRYTKNVWISNFFLRSKRIVVPVGYAEHYEKDSGLIVYLDHLHSTEWRTAQDSEGRLYFYNQDDLSVWTLPMYVFIFYGQIPQKFSYFQLKNIIHKKFFITKIFWYIYICLCTYILL